MGRSQGDDGRSCCFLVVVVVEVEVVVVILMVVLLQVGVMLVVFCWFVVMVRVSPSFASKRNEAKRKRI